MQAWRNPLGPTLSKRIVARRLDDDSLLTPMDVGPMRPRSLDHAGTRTLLILGAISLGLGVPAAWASVSPPSLEASRVLQLEAP